MLFTEVSCNILEVIMLTFIPHIVLSITPVIRKKKVKLTRLEKQIKHGDGFAISENPFAARGCEVCKENTKQSGVSRNSVLKSGPRTAKSLATELNWYQLQPDCSWWSWGWVISSVAIG